MKPSLMDYAEKELFEVIDNKKSLNVYVFDYERELKEELSHRGYKKVHSQPITVFKYESGFPKRKLPEGFSIISLEDENDFEK